MNWIGTLFWLLPKRLRSSWALLAITAFGVLAAVTLMSLGAVYTRALAEAGLRHSIASTSQEILNTHIISQNRPLGPSDYNNLRSNLEEIVENRVGFMIRGHTAIRPAPAGDFAGKGTLSALATAGRALGPSLLSHRLPEAYPAD